MTMLEYLRSLTHPDGLSLLASRGVLSTEEEIEAAGSSHPYALLFGLPDASSGQFYGGGQEMTQILDVVLEVRPIVPGQVPDIAQIERLYLLAGEAPEHVTELMTGVPLVDRLRYIGGAGRPEQHHKIQDWLTAGLSFEAKFWTRH